MKYVVITGGVVGGIGKGIIGSSAGLLLKCKGLTATSIKVDPYINIDANTMSPLEHGEIYVTDDGGAMSLDLGHYERYLSITLSQDHHITLGKIYQQVIDAERAGKYQGKRVQIVPHVTDAIQSWIERVAKVPVDGSGLKPDVCIIELGGTAGDIECSAFLYALARLRKKTGEGNFAHIHVSYIPIVPPGAAGEQKTKPTQRALQIVRSAGMIPDVIVCRCDVPLELATIRKIATMCSKEPEEIFGVHDVPTTYHVPMLLRQQNFVEIISKQLNLLPTTTYVPAQRIANGASMWKTWLSLAHGQEIAKKSTSIALVGDFVSRKDAYMSITKALEHAAMYCHSKAHIKWINATHLNAEHCEKSPAEFHHAWSQLLSADGVLVSDGSSGVTDGVIKAIKWARTNNKPFLGISQGMHLAVMEYAQFLGLGNCDKEELHLARDEIKICMPDTDVAHTDGSFRTGRQSCIFEQGKEWSKLRRLHGVSVSQIEERHRTRFTVNPDLIDIIENGGLSVIGKDVTGKHVEIVEIRKHPWFVGVQFHPEFLSRVLQPSKTILGFFAAAAGCLEKKIEALDQGLQSFEERTLPCEISQIYGVIAALPD